MDVRPVDPRDVRWEVDAPVYRVHFWTQPVAPSGIPPERVMYRSTEYELTDVQDVDEVLAWIEGNCPPGSTSTLYALVDGPGEPGLVRLAGRDPTAASYSGSQESSTT